jgi:hypothetical protein
MMPRFEEEKGGDPIEITKRERERLQITTMSPWPPAGAPIGEEKRVELMSQGPIKGLYTQATKLVQWRS